MSPPHQHRCPLPPPPNDVALDDLNLHMETKPMEIQNNPLYVQRSFTQDDTTSESLCETQYSWLALQLHQDSAVLSSEHGPQITPQWPYGQPVVTSLSSPSSDDGWARNHTTSPTRATYGPCQNILAAFDPPRMSWTTSLDTQSPPPCDRKTSTFLPLLDPLSLPPSDSVPTHAMHLPNQHSQPSIPQNYPPYHLFTPIPFYFGPYPTSTGFLQTDPSYPSFSRMSSCNSTGSSRRHRSNARAIAHDGMWVDEEELVKGLMEPDGKITIHPCRLEEDRSPCHLWIRSDELCIKAHIRKWHRGQPGKDNSRVDCRWSACGTTMRKDSIARHIVTMHFGEMWECQGCGKSLVRGDVYRRHAMKSDFDACRVLGALTTYPGGAREIDARAALDEANHISVHDRL